MLELGKIDFRKYPPKKPFIPEIIIGRVELGQAVSFSRTEAQAHPEGKAGFERETRNRIRRQMWQRVHGHLIKILFEARNEIRYAMGPTSDFKKVNDAFDKIMAEVEYPAESDEKEPMRPVEKPPTP